MKKKNWFLKFFSTSFQFFSFFVAFVCKTVFWGKKRFYLRKHICTKKIGNFWCLTTYLLTPTKISAIMEDCNLFLAQHFWFNFRNYKGKEFLPPTMNTPNNIEWNNQLEKNWSKNKVSCLFLIWLVLMSSMTRKELNM